MFLSSVFFLLTVLVSARYQFLAEKDIFDVITLSREEAQKRIHSGDGPSYILTKRRIKYNCTNTYEYNSKANDNELTTVSKDRLQDKCYVGSSEIGFFTVCPSANVTIQKENSEPSVFLIDLSKHGLLRLGDSLSTSAKMTEYFLRSTGESGFESIVVTYRCFRSVVMSSKRDVPFDLTIDKVGTSEQALAISLRSDYFCMTQDEEAAFVEIRKRMKKGSDTQKAVIKSGNWQYTINHKVNITQKYSGDEMTYVLGEYNEEATLAQGYGIVRVFKPSDPEDTYVNMIYTNGEECATTGRNRTANVRLVCPSSPGVSQDTVIETTLCHYEVITGTPWVCSLPWMKPPVRTRRSVICYPLEDDSNIKEENAL